MLIPSTIQALHTLKKHQHKVCKAVGEYHLHQLEIDCSKLHIPFATFSTEIPVSYLAVKQHFYKCCFNSTPQQTKAVYIYKKSSRAPPYL